MSWAEARARFPVLERYAYLNAGTFGPLARATLDAMAALRALGGRARARRARRTSRRCSTRRERVRALLAEQIARPGRPRRAHRVDDAAACTIVVTGLGLGAGDEVVTTDAEHFGLTGPLVASGARLRIAQRARRAGGGRLRADRARRSRRARG